MTPWFALFWKMSGEENPGWSCVGLYETEEEARSVFHEWSSVYDGLLVMARVEQVASRGISRSLRALSEPPYVLEEEQ